MAADNEKLAVGETIAARRLVAVSGEAVRLPDPARLTHLQFRRFAGCPVCDLHLRALARRSGEIAAAGIVEVVLFHSSASDLRPYVAELPFLVVPDPGKALYREFGVESSPRALTDPRAWGAIVRGVAASLGGILFRGRAVPPLNPEGGRFGLPADILIGPDGRVLAAHYGEHADDQWSVDELLAQAAASARAARGS